MRAAYLMPYRIMKTKSKSIISNFPLPKLTLNSHELVLKA